MGVAIELAGYRAAFPRADESVVDALRRTRPAYVLIDGADPNASDPTVLGRGMMSGVRIFLFADERRAALLEPVAEKYELDMIVLPRDAESLGTILSRRRVHEP